MRSLWLLVPLMLAGSAAAQIGPPCCRPAGGDPDVDEAPPILVRADTRRPNERALAERAEEAVPPDVPITGAVGPIFVGKPAEEPVEAQAAALPLAPVADDHGPPCCDPADEFDIEEPPPIVVRADTRRPDERALVVGAQAPVRAAVQLPDALGPIFDGEPAEAPAEAEAAALPLAPDGDPFTPPCCESAEQVDIEDPPPIFVRADTRRPDERALVAPAEAPVPAKAPMPDAVGSDVSVEPPGVTVEPGAPAPVTALDVDIETAPCCEAAAEPDIDEPPPIFVRADTRRPNQRALTTAAEAPVSVATQVTEVRAVPAEAAPEPAVPADGTISAVEDGGLVTMVVIALLILLTMIGTLVSRRRPQPSLGPLPARPLPFKLSPAAGLAQLEALLPTPPAPVPASRAAQPERELEPA